MKSATLPLRVLLAIGHGEHTRPIEQALQSAGHKVVSVMTPDEDIVIAVQRVQPDALIVELEAPNRELFHSLQLLHERQPLPVVVFARLSENRDIRVAVRSGVSAYVVDGFRPSRVAPVLEAALMRFLEFQALRGERDEALAKLSERRAIERAKGILMRRRDLPEDAAYEALRKMALNHGRRTAEVAEYIITAEEALSQH